MIYIIILLTLFGIIVSVLFFIKNKEAEQNLKDAQNWAHQFTARSEEYYELRTEAKKLQDKLKTKEIHNKINNNKKAR